MNRLKAITGYALALLSLVGFMVVILGLGGWMNLLVSATGLTVSPWFSGGQVVRTVEHGAYRTEIHRPVFDALIGERSEGFVQVSWRPDGAVPERLDEEVDYNGDGKADFRVQVGTSPREAALTPYAPGVVSVSGPYHLTGAWAVRVELRK